MAGMSLKSPVLKCFIAGILQQQKDPYFEQHGFSRGLILFAIPDLGVLFRCRAYGNPADLEFGAFFALMRFIDSRLKKQGISRVTICSSSPEFIFALAHLPRSDSPDMARLRLLNEFRKKFDIRVKYVTSQVNQALFLTSDIPSMPPGRELPFKPGSNERRKSEFKSLQKGIRV